MIIVICLEVLNYLFFAQLLSYSKFSVLYLFIKYYMYSITLSLYWYVKVNDLRIKFLEGII